MARTLIVSTTLAPAVAHPAESFGLEDGALAVVSDRAATVCEALYAPGIRLKATWEAPE